MPDAVPRIVRRQVRAVHHEILSRFGQILLDFGPCGRPQWTDHRAAHRRDAGKAARSCPPRQVEQHGFQIIVCGVGGRNARNAVLRGAPVQARIAQRTRGRLDALVAAGGIGRGVLPLQRERNIEPRTQGADKVRIALRFRPAQAMV